MWLDNNLVLCDKTSFFGAASVGNLIGDIIDLGQFDSGKPTLSGGVPAVANVATHPNFGGVMPMTMLFRITKASTHGTATFNFKLYSSDGASGNQINSLDSLHWQSGPIPPNGMVTGREMIVPIPWDSFSPVRRYLQMDVDRTATSTDGEVSVMLIAGAHQWEAMHGNYVQV